jgi:para-nitrobenzyl esterase
MGAYHTSELPYVFNNLEKNPFTQWKPEDQKIANIMSSYVVNFVKNLNPNGLPYWPMQTIDKNSVFEVGNNFKEIPLIINGDLNKKLDFYKRFWSTQKTM